VGPYETLLYEQSEGVGWVTLNRPEVHNAFDAAMQRELHELWQGLRTDDDVRAVVITGAGERAFCSGIDRSEALADLDALHDVALVGNPGESPFMFDDPGVRIGPKSNDFWKPVIAAVNGMAAAGAFYILGECDIFVAADHATFFDPHVTFGMVSSFESIHMAQRMPLGEVIRMQLLGSYERLSAERAFQLGLVSEVVPLDRLREAAGWVAETIATMPTLVVQGTLRAIWATREFPRAQALGLGYAYVGMGNRADQLEAGQQRFASGRRIEPRVR
jgi:enoyl-CoA hydratase/carnithine racemase